MSTQLYNLGKFESLSDVDQFKTQWVRLEYTWILPAEFIIFWFNQLPNLALFLISTLDQLLSCIK